MFVKIVDVHPEDAHYHDRERLIGATGYFTCGSETYKGYVSGEFEPTDKCLYTRHFLAVRVERVQRPNPCG